MEITDSNSRILIISLLNVLFIMRQLNVFIKTKKYTWCKQNSSKLNQVHS